jgi:pSer/pThr/pTyr-binding forkhead associated (FHA) protein
MEDTRTALTRPLVAKGPFLRVVSSAQASAIGRMVPLGTSPLTIGRSTQATLSVDDRGLSRLHAQVVSNGAHATVVDLESHNGTWVNGERVTRKQLREGDLLQLGGRLTLRFVVDETAETNTFERASVLAGAGTFRFHRPSGAFHLDAHAGRTLVAPGITGWDCVVPAQRAALREALTQAVSSGRCDVQVQLVGPGARAPWAALRGEVFDEGSNLVGVAFDITAQKEVEAQLRRQGATSPSGPAPPQPSSGTPARSRWASTSRRS